MTTTEHCCAWNPRRNRPISLSTAFCNYRDIRQEPDDSIMQDLRGGAPRRFKVDEQWRSPDLQLSVLSKHADPRMGETVYSLTNISRAEPSPTLFQVPPEYT